MPMSPLDDLVASIAGLGHGRTESVQEGVARPDFRREERTGAPEVIFASGKDPEQIRSIVDSFITRRGRAIVSRIGEDDARQLIEVYPAAEMIPRAKSNDATVIEINLTETEASRHADVGLYGPSGQVLPRLVAAI